MKIYKVSLSLFLILPIFIFSIILSYGLILFKNSYTVVNVANLLLDGAVLLYYFTNFCREVRMDSQGINFYTLFKKYRFRVDEINSMSSASFLTSIKTTNKRLYILTTSKGQKVLKELFKDIKGSH